jgi:hypothetical protein
VSEFDQLYNTPMSELSLTDLHRIIRRAKRRQAKVAWLLHRQRRIRILAAERRQRIAAIADRWSA